MTREKLQHHWEHLAEKHQKLDQQVDHMEATGHFDDMELVDLKKHRLALKDEMAVIQAKIQNIGG